MTIFFKSSSLFLAQVNDQITKIDKFYALEILGFTVGDLLLSFGLVLAAFISHNILAKIIFKQLLKLAQKTKTEYDDRVILSLEIPVSYFIFTFGIYLAIIVFPLETEAHKIYTLAFKGISMFFVIWGILRLVDVASDVFQETTEKKGLSISGFVPLIKKAVRAFIIILGIIIIIDNLGYSVSGFLATLGLGGAAFAFAAKDTIANLYGSVALALDRPFKVGDWITVGNQVDGDVEEIGLRSTKVRTWPKTVISIPNNVLANEIVNNWSRMPKRRVKQIIGITYDSSPENIEGLVEDIKKILMEDQGINNDFTLVNFNDFGESSLNLLVYYFTKTTAWLGYMNIKQRINIKIMHAVKERGLSFAFPTRTLNIDRETEKNFENFSDQNIPQNDTNLPGDHGPTEPY